MPKIRLFLLVILAAFVRGAWASARLRRRRDIRERLQAALEGYSIQPELAACDHWERSIRSTDANAPR